MKSYRFRVYANKQQDAVMRQHLWASKNLWNSGLTLAKQMYDDFGKFPTRKTLQEISKDSGLYSQVAQGVFVRLSLALKANTRRKKAGLKGGFPRFKSFDRMKSLHYPQSGFELLPNKKLQVTPFGKLNIKQHRPIEGKIKALTLKREASGKWFAIFTIEQDEIVPLVNNGGRVGIDLGLTTLATLSNGLKIKNPRHFDGHREKLAKLQRRLSRALKGGKNRRKAKLKVALAHEKIANVRRDFLHKATANLVNSYSFIALEELSSQRMAEQNFGKQINDAGWETFAGMIAYKAVEAGCKVVFVNPKNTTQECSGCHELVKKDLTVRVHDCSHCGLVLDRDVNAAINILVRATVGTTESNACEDGAIVPSVKQEATTCQ